MRACDGECDCTCLEAGFDLFDQASVGSPAALVAEPVLSAGGVIVPPPGYFARLVDLCAERGMLVVFDECQTGLGRLGTMYGFERYGVVPDFLVLSKTLGGGVPIGAVVTSAALEERCHELGFIHVTSHVSDPLPAAAALAVLELVSGEDLPARAERAGARARRPPRRAGLPPRGDRRGPRHGAAARRRAGRGPRQPSAGGGARRRGVRGVPSGAGSRSISCAAGPAAPPTACGSRRR